MKKNQFIIDIPEIDNSKEAHPLLSIKIDPSIPLDNVSIDLIRGDMSIPVRLIYGYSHWIIHEGHDYRLDKKSRIFSTRSSIYDPSKKLLFHWGDEIKCSKGHEIRDDHNFCTECGEKLDYNKLFAEQSNPK